MEEGKWFVVRSHLNGMVLDVQDGVGQAGQPVTTYEFNGGDNQLWCEDTVLGVIRSKLDENLVLEVTGDMLIINDLQPGEYQQNWMLAGDRIAHAQDPDKCLDISDCNPMPGARVCSWEYGGGPNQVWNFEYMPAAPCRIVSVASGKVLDVRDGNADPGEKVILWDMHDDVQDNQLFYEDKYGFIHSKLNDFVFDTSEGSARLFPYDHELPGHQWVKSGTKIVNKLDSTQCLEATGGGLLSHPKLVAATYTGAENQTFIFEYL